MSTLLDQPDAVRTALSPLRRELLDLLREPASATQLATSLGMPRQRINYHLRALEGAGLVELVEERQRRGCVERILRAKSGFVVDPGLVGGQFERITDQYAAGHLIASAADAVRDVSRMLAAANDAGKRLMTFTVEADVRFATPKDAEAFTDELAALVQGLVDRYDTPRGLRHRLVAFAHPGARR